MNRRERKKEETRDKIFTCALELFHNKGFEQTSMEEIAETADISKGTLYNYFSDKESILVAYFQSLVAAYGKDFEKHLKDAHGITERLNALMEFVNSMLKNNSELATVYAKFRLQNFFENDPADSSRRSGIEGLLLKILQEAQANKEIRDDIPALVLTRSFQFLIRSYMQASILSDQPVDINTFKQQIIDFFLNGAGR